MSLHHLEDIKNDCPLCMEKLSQAHPNLSYWFLKCVKPSFPCAHISWSYRNQIDQDQAFKEGKSKLHYPNSAHNATNGGKPESRALDLFKLQMGTATWPVMMFHQIADQTERQGIKLIWGGTFKSISDQDHYELLEVV